jgi:iron complex transport system ATP-binding protein
LDGKSVSSYPKRVLARRIALVPQNFYINFPFTAQEVVMMGRYPHLGRFTYPSEEDQHLVAKIMDRTGTIEFKDRRVTELSGGERQRVVFARALAQNTDCLVLDEATSNLDISHSLALLQLVAGRVATLGRTAIAVFQDINLAAAHCDELIFMQAGRIAASGPVDAVLTPKILSEVFDVEARVYDEPFTGARQVAFRR